MRWSLDFCRQRRSITRNCRGQERTFEKQAVWTPMFCDVSDTHEQGISSQRIERAKTNEMPHLVILKSRRILGHLKVPCKHAPDCYWSTVSNPSVAPHGPTGAPTWSWVQSRAMSESAESAVDAVLAGPVDAEHVTFNVAVSASMATGAEGTTLGALVSAVPAEYGS